MSSTAPRARALPRGIRNHNPGNIVRSRTAWQGEKPWAAGDDPEFEVFTAPEWGIRAMATVLLNYQRRHRLLTVRAMIARWAPPVHVSHDGSAVPQDTGAYVRAVAKALGVAPDAEIDVSRPGTMRALLRAVISHENGRQPYTDAQLDDGMRRAGIQRPEA